LKKILSVVGARPNFMKMAPIHKELLKYKKKVELLKYKKKVTHRIIHTGQHYDKKMSDVFFRELELPKPHIFLGVGSKSHTQQKAEIMTEFEKVVMKEKPDMVLVYGDVNSTTAAALVCAKTDYNGKTTIPLAHIESGLRSFDRMMPEEINRIVTDNLSNYHFITEKSGIKNLLKEGFSSKNMFMCGNTMIDSLKFYLKNTMIDSLKFYLKKINKSKILKSLSVSEKNFALITLHRPSNVDNLKNLKKIFGIFKGINKINPNIDLVFPIHPRTQKMIEKFGLEKSINEIQNLIITEPLGYLDFLKLTSSAKYILTDSGGIQEESTVLKIPCLTLRENTERPVTYEVGTNTICGLNEKLI